MELKAAAEVLITDPAYESLGKVRYRYLLQEILIQRRITYVDRKDEITDGLKANLQMTLYNFCD
jgi:hypothetical protein